MVACVFIAECIFYLILNLRGQKGPVFSSSIFLIPLLPKVKYIFETVHWGFVADYLLLSSEHVT